jgi:hypothetical protein
MQITKQDIKYLPLQELQNLTVVESELWCEQHKLSHFHTWLLPQVLAHFGGWSLAKNNTGVLDVVNTLKQNIGNDAWQRGLWKLTRVKRSLLMPKQTASAEYASFTPLILAGLKKMQGVEYERWRGLDNLNLIMEPQLLAAVELEDYNCCTLGSERLLELREQGLVTQGGKTAGKHKPAESTWALAGLQGTELDGLPKWTQTMLTQCWLAHPKNRTHSMILDPQNWDRMPDPLISTELFQKPEPAVVPKQKQLDIADLPF